MKEKKVIKELLKMQIKRLEKELKDINEQKIEELSYLISLKRGLKKQLEEITTVIQIQEEEVK